MQWLNYGNIRRGLNPGRINELAFIYLFICLFIYLFIYLFIFSFLCAILNKIIFYPR